MTAIHGFLGLPTDWDSVLPTSSSSSFCKSGWSSKLAGIKTAHGSSVLPELAQELNSEGHQDRSEVLIGYSMGGRIAMHMLIADRAIRRWAKAVIVSASPGICRLDERRRRWDQDREWAERFRTEEWRILMADWESQTVFNGDQPVLRKEDEFAREELADALERGSVGLQEDLRGDLAELEIPILWLAGERDGKYCELASACSSLNTRFEFGIIEDAGHRAPWSNTKGFQIALNRFLGR